MRWGVFSCAGGRQAITEVFSETEGRQGRGERMNQHKLGCGGTWGGRMCLVLRGASAVGSRTWNAQVFIPAVRSAGSQGTCAKAV